ncbi:hypothetical protein HYY75_01780 [bacterium]|nr:hypothetical protein [bacterium]
MAMVSSRWVLLFFLLSLISLFFFPSTSYALEGWMKYFRKDILLNTYSRAYAVDHEKLWVGTNGDGIVVYTGKDTRNFNSKNTNSLPNLKDGLVSDNITCLLVDQPGERVWVGTNEGLSSCNLDAKDWRRFSSKDGLPNDIIRDIAIDEKGIIWVATPSGVASFDGSVWKTYSSQNGLFEDNVQSLKTLGGSVWIATVGGSICRFDGTSWKTFMHY